MIQPGNKLNMTDSQLNMWRAVIAIAHADGTVQQEEKDYLYKTLANIDRSYNLTDAQRMALANDLKTPQNISTLIPLITDPQHRAMLVHFGEVLAWADNEISVDEEAILKKLHDGQMQSVDRDRLRADIQKKVHEQEADYDQQMSAVRDDKRNPVFRALDRLMKKAGIDILE